MKKIFLLTITSLTVSGCLNKDIAPDKNRPEPIVQNIPDRFSPLRDATIQTKTQGEWYCTTSSPSGRPECWKPANPDITPVNPEESSDRISSILEQVRNGKTIIQD